MNHFNSISTFIVLSMAVMLVDGQTGWCGTRDDVRVVTAAASIVDHGDASVPGSLAGVIREVGPKFAAVELAGNATYVIGKDLVVPENVTLRFGKGAVLSVSGKKTLTINGGIEAGYQQIFDGPGEVTGAVKVSSVLPQWFGAKGDEVTDDTTAVQKALDFACKTRVLSVDLNRGRYRITRTIDCTSTRIPGTITRDGLRVFGSSFTGTALMGETGDKSAVIDTSGCQWLHLENFQICTGTKNRSSIGLFTGVPELLPQSQNHVYHIAIFLFDDMKANDGLGTIGLWNFASEEHTYNSIYIHANRPVLLTAYNGMNGYNYTKSYVKLVKMHSLGVTTFTGECFLMSLGKSAPAVTTVDINSLNMQNTYICGAGNGKYTCAFQINGSLSALTYSGTIEGFAGFGQINGQLYSANVNCVYGLVADPTEAVIVMGPDGQIRNSDFKVHLCENGSRNLFRVIEPAKGQKATCAISNSTFKTNQGKERMVLPSELKKNSSNVVVSNHDATFVVNRPASQSGR